MVEALVGVGGNVGAVVETMRAAAAELGAIRASRIYRSRPMYRTDQPEFLNAVLAVPTEDSPGAFLARLKAIETRLGRIARERNGPRELDLDLLSYGEEIVRLPGLDVPHPRLDERRFVLLPMSEVAPWWKDPVSGRTMNDLLSATVDQASHLEAIPDALLRI